MELTVDAATIAFADDLALIVGGRNEEVLKSNCNTCLDEIGRWMQENELTLALEKTEAVIVKGPRRRDLHTGTSDYNA